MPFQRAPVLFPGLRQLEDHRQNAGARNANTRLRSQAHRGEGRFDRVRGANCAPNAPPENHKRQQGVPCFRQTLRGLRILRFIS